MMWFYFLTLKSEAYSEFLEFKDYIEKESWKQLECLTQTVVTSSFTNNSGIIAKKMKSGNSFHFIEVRIKMMHEKSGALQKKQEA